MPVADRRWRAMGGEAHVVVVAPSPHRLAAAAVLRVAQLESRWSRFVASSDICRIAAAAGRPTQVSQDTIVALTCAVAGWQATAGRFDPSVGTVLSALGYDRTFEEIATRDMPPAATPTATPDVPGCSGLQIDAANRVVTARPGIALDLGGIGKGLAADLVATEALKAGADGVCVNLGGDLRVAGTPPTDDGWAIAVEDPHDPEREVLRLTLTSGAVATSNADGRRWRTSRSVIRHVVDPLTGRPVDPIGSVTVVAGECWWAEVLATAGTVAGAAALRGLIPALGGEFVHVGRDGAVTTSTGLGAFAA